jgi:uncharacterized protein YprB with RNaseH-like and TPR domain
MVRRRGDLKRELEALKKKAEGAFRREKQRFELRPPEAKRIHEAVPGEIVPHAGGEFYRVLTDASAVWPTADAFYCEYIEALASPSFAEAVALEALRPLVGVKSSEVCYLDIETTGLSSAPLFLIGLMYERGGRARGGAEGAGGASGVGECRLTLDQLFARDYSEEETVLRYLKKLMGAFRVLVTFNGVSFDVPFIQERMAMHRIRAWKPETHIDLLPLARCVVGPKTPNHKLQTLEAYLCKRKRVGDIKGADIPEAYHEYVRTGNAKDMATIFHHNRLDLVTMLQLVTIFLSGGY